MADIASALTPCLPWLALFQVMYYVFGGIASLVSPKYRGFNDYEKNYFNTTLVSAAHAILVHALGLPFLFATPSWAAEASIADTHPAVQRLNHMFFAYVLSDLRFVLPWAIKLGKSDDVAFVMHHVCILLTWMSFLVSEWGHLFALCTILTELTQVNVGARWVLHQWGYSSHPLYMINGVAMLLGWWYWRIYGYVAFLGWRIFQLRGDLMADEAHYVRHSFVFVCWILGSGLQLMWGWKITAGAAKLLFGKKKAKEGK